MRAADALFAAAWFAFPVRAAAADTAACLKTAEPGAVLASVKKLWSEVGDPTVRPSDRLAALSRALLRYQLCEAGRSESPESCAGLKGVYNALRDPVDKLCEERYGYYSFLRGALKAPSAEAADVKGCLAMIGSPGSKFEMFPGHGADACRRLARAFRAAYSPVCSDLAWGGWLNPDFNVEDFFTQCETYFYVPNPHSCLRLTEPLEKEDCLEKAAEYVRLKSGAPSTCGQAWKDVQTLYCGGDK